MQKNLVQTLKIVFLALILSVGIAFVSAGTWKGPTQAPTGGNVEAPVNVGAQFQDKIGSLALGNFPLSISGPGNLVTTGDIFNAGHIQSNSLSGTGDRPVCADSNGMLKICGTVPTKPQCSDGVDNDSDGLIDSADPGCHTDNNASNSAS